jgi:sortase A
VLLSVLAVGVISYPFVSQLYYSHLHSGTADSFDDQAAHLQAQKRADMLAAAQRYNAQIALAGGGLTISDPFSGLATSYPLPGSTAGPVDPGSSTGSVGADAVTGDEYYRSILDVGSGVMGTVDIPKISVHLPIYHGTSEAILANGAGHVFGTSLPVGGVSTHAVITSHRGLPDRALFTRIDELREGDAFYIEMLGEKLGYRVDDIQVVDPKDTAALDALRVVPGEDYVTLLTCTPYGVNTHRLLVRGVRGEIGSDVPSPDSYFDWLPVAVIAAPSLALLLLVWWTYRIWRTPKSRPRRAT